MANNLAVSITADVADFTAKMAVAQVAAKDYGKAMRDVAKQVADGDTSTETKTNLLQVAFAYSKATAEVALYKRELAGAKGPGQEMKAGLQEVTASSGSMRFAMRDLSYQIGDVATMFSMGAPPMQIFATQGSQVIQALQMMSGEAKGLLGFLGGPWGLILSSAAIAMGPLIGKLFETEDAAHSAKEALRSASDAARELAGTQNALKLNQAQMDLNKIVEQRMRLENVIATSGPGGTRNPYARDPDASVGDRNYELGGAARRIQELKWQEVQAQNEIKLAEGMNAETDARMAAAAHKGSGQGHSSGGGHATHRGAGSAGGANGSDTAMDDIARTAKAAADAELREQIAVNRQKEALAEDDARTQIELSRSALTAKLANLDAEQRAGTISSAQALEQRTQLNDQIAQLDADLEQRLFEAKRNELQKNQSNYASDTADYRDYQRQIEQIERQHLNRVAIMRAKAAEKERLEKERAAEQERQRANRIAQPFAQQFARLATLQQGFLATMRGMWGSLVGLAEQALAQIVEQWIVKHVLMTTIGKIFGLHDVATNAGRAASGAYAATAAIPIVGPALAPGAAATAGAAAMSIGTAMFTARDGYDVPALAGPGVDGKGGQLGIVHPREMVLPERMANVVRSAAWANAASPMQLAGEQRRADVSQAFAQVRPEVMRMASPPVLQIPGRARAPFADDAGFFSGGAAARNGKGSGAGSDTHLTVQAMDARSFERFAKRNKSGLAKAARSYARNNGR